MFVHRCRFFTQHSAALHVTAVHMTIKALKIPTEGTICLLVMHAEAATLSSGTPADEATFLHRT